MFQEIWPQFVQEFSNEFNEILKSCAPKIAEKFVKLDNSKGSAATGDSEMTLNGTLSNDFETLYSNMDFSDVELEVEGKTLKAHKVILSSN
jgi:hypothetical protein